MEQPASPCTFEPQVVVSEKSAALVPVSEMLVMLTVDWPTLDSVTFFTGLFVPTLTLPKLRDGGESWIWVPVPVSDTVWGLPAALSFTFNVAVSVLMVVGLNLTLIEQLALGATLVPQELVSVKRVGFAPLKV